MDDLVTPGHLVKRSAAPLAALALALALAMPAGAQALRDPTRPPDSLLAPIASAAPAAAAAPQLQSILIARHPGGRNIAVIDGMMLRPGDRYKGYVVDRMSETEVVLLKGQTRQILKLYAGAAVDTRARPAPAAIDR